MLAPLPHDEPERLRELSRCAIMDTPPELAFDRITRLVARIFEAPVALVSLVDSGRQWFKSRHGTDLAETSRDQSFCTYAILETSTMVVPDTHLDPRFRSHPLVLGPSLFRFYAGAPLITSGGYRLGTLCFFDAKPRRFGPEGIAILEDLAAMVVDEIELRLDSTHARCEVERHRRADISLRATRDELEARVQERTAELAEVEERYRSLFENAVSGIYRTLPGADGILDVNPAFATLFGYPSPEALIAAVQDANAVYVQPGRRDELRRLLETDGIITAAESEVFRADGTRVWISESARAIRDADGRVVRYEGTVEDITTRRTNTETLRRAHEELEDRVHERTAELALFNGTLRQQIADRERAEDNARRSETKFRALIENAQDLTSIVAPEGVVLYISPSVEHILGYPPDDVTGRDLFEGTIHPDDRDALRAQFAHTVESGARYVRSEARYRHRDGSWRLLESISSCAPPDFPIVSLVVNSRDITDRRHNEREREVQVRQQTAMAELGRFALRDPELPAIFEKASNLIAGALEVPFAVVCELLPGGTLLALRSGVGWQGSVVGKTVTNWRTLSPDGSWANPEPQVIEDVRRARGYVALDQPTIHGEPVSAISVVVHSGGRPFGTLTALSAEPREFSTQDVTFLQTVADLLSAFIEGKRQEAVSREAQARYQRIVANVPGAVYQLGQRPDGTEFLPFISEGCRQLYGMDAATLCANPSFMAEAVHPEDRAAHDAASVVSAQTLRPFEWEGRIRTPSAETRWIAKRSRPERLPGGDIIWDGVVLDVSELKRAQETMREAKEEAEKANRAKSEFLSRMSHELRTPLNAILGFSQLLSLDQLTPVQTSGVEQILKAGRHLLDLINEVLDIARIEAGAMEMTPERVDAAGALAEAALFTRPLAEQRRVTFVNRAPDRPLAVTADRGRLKQVLLNLFSNAVKYNREGGEVRFGCELLAGARTVRLSVTDTGPGLTKEELPLLFTPFQRLGAAHRGIPGTGIGLSIAKSLTEAMAGTINVKSTPGEGCVFFVDLPVSPESPTSAALAAAPTPGAFVSEIPSARTVLHIDDQPANLSLVERVLETRADLRLIAATEGRAGLALAREQRPDLILLDLHLPDLAGEEVVRRLHNEPRTRNIPIVVLSADATPGQITRLRQLGVREYITKPFKIPALLQTLDALLYPTAE